MSETRKVERLRCGVCGEARERHTGLDGHCPQDVATFTPKRETVGVTDVLRMLKANGRAGDVEVDEHLHPDGDLEAVPVCQYFAAQAGPYKEDTPVVVMSAEESEQVADALRDLTAERDEARALAETWIEMPPQFQHSPDETELHLFAMYLYAKGQREKREAAEGLLGDAYNALFHQHQDVSALLDEIDRALDGEGSE